MSQAQHVCACCVYAGPLARDRRRGSITRLHTHTQRWAGLSPGSRHRPLWVLGPGQSESRWLYQPGQAGHGGMEFGQGLKDQH